MDAGFVEVGICLGKSLHPKVDLGFRVYQSWVFAQTPVGLSFGADIMQVRCSKYRLQARMRGVLAVHTVVVVFGESGATCVFR